MGLRAQLRLKNPAEAEAALLGLVAVNLQQLRGGIGPISHLLQADRRGRRRVRYIRLDPGEEWLSLRDIRRRRGGDCEDLAAAITAELITMGIPAQPIIRKVRPGLWHAMVQRLDTGAILDPSRTGGMGE